jgi:radical SAM protein with 4Fe4S-binding SPASM domain
VRLAAPLLSRPDFARSLVAQQLDKQLFNLRYPRRAHGRANRIRQLSIRLTDACNLRCHTCGQWGDRGYLLGVPAAALHKREVSPARYIELFDDLRAQGHRPILYLWGGEPMLYRGVLELIEHAAKLGFPPSIATNGTRVAEQAERLVAAPLAILQLSVDGATADDHDAARPAAGGSSTNFDDVVAACSAVRAARRRRAARMPMIVTLTTISRRNSRQLCAIYERFHELADLCVFYLSWWIDEAQADAHSDDFERRFGERPTRHHGWRGDWSRVDSDGLARELTELRALAAEKGTPAYVMPDLREPADIRRYYADHQATFGFDQCISIFQNVEIDADGSLVTCRDYSDYRVGNIKTQTITELWNAPRYRAFRTSLEREGLMPVCTRCCGLMGH